MFGCGVGKHLLKGQKMNEELWNKFRKIFKLPKNVDIGFRKATDEWIDISIGGTEEEIEKFKNQDHLVQVEFEGITEKDEEDPDYRVGYFKVFFKAKVV